MCGRFCFRLLAPPDIKALDCPGRIRYPHIFVPANAFTPLSDLRLLTLYSARSALVSHVVVHAFCSSCGVPVFRASGAFPCWGGRCLSAHAGFPLSNHHGTIQSNR